MIRGTHVVILANSFSQTEVRFWEEKISYFSCVVSCGCPAFKIIDVRIQGFRSCLLGPAGVIRDRSLLDQVTFNQQKHMKRVNQSTKPTCQLSGCQTCYSIVELVNLV